MFEQIFGSKTRVQLITIFLRNPDKGFYIRELSRITGQYLNSIRRELDNLEKFGLLKTETKYKKKFYLTDDTFFLLSEMKDLFLKGRVFLENDLTTALKEIGDIRLLIFTGNFTGVDTQTDVLLVGEDINTVRLREILENFSLTVAHEIRYTVLGIREYEYRREIADKFIQEIFRNKNIVLVDKFGG
ncbi:MAG: hypothetical protein HY564_02395 [Candidatus Jacksonbacteria bacterium]|nr:hypothetical protein [Candidatus Jacksonbacteria bacterium]